jgi:hypothetical protein
MVGAEDEMSQHRTCWRVLVVSLWTGILLYFFILFPLGTLLFLKGITLSVLWIGFVFVTLVAFT